MRGFAIVVSMFNFRCAVVLYLNVKFGTVSSNSYLYNRFRQLNSCVFSLAIVNGIYATVSRQVLIHTAQAYL